MATDDHTHLLEEFKARGTEVSAAGVQVFAIAVQTRQNTAAKQSEADSLLASAEPSGTRSVVTGVLAMWWIRAWTRHNSRNQMCLKGVVVRVDGTERRMTLGQMDRLTSKAKSWKAIMCRGAGGALYRLSDAVSDATLRCERSAGPPRPPPTTPTTLHVATTAPRPADADADPPPPETEPIDTDDWLRDNATARAAPIVPVPTPIPSESVPAVQVHAWPVDACPHDARIQQLERLVGSLAGVVAGLQGNMSKVVTVLESDIDVGREPVTARDADDTQALRAQIRRLDDDVRDRDSTISRLARLLEDKADECTRLRSIKTKRASGEPPRGRSSRARRARRDDDDDDDCSNDASDDASDAARHLKRGAWGWPNAPLPKRKRAIDPPQRSSVQMVVLS